MTTSTDPTHRPEGEASGPTASTATDDLIATSADPTHHPDGEASGLTACVDEVVDAYLAAFSADDATRRALVEQAFAPEAHFADPLFAATGHDEITALAAQVPELYPGHAFRRSSGIDLHHGQARWSWDFVASDGTVAVEGVDVAQLGADGRLVRVVGFFGPVPAL